MNKCDSPQCNTPLEYTAKEAQLKADNPMNKIFCPKCRTRMVNDRIGAKMGWIRKDSLVTK